MIRRDFFRSLAAATAAFYSGSKVVEAAVPPPAPLLPTTAIAVTKLPPPRTVKADPQEVLKQMLRGAAAVSIQRTDSLDGPSELEVEYLYSEGHEYPVNCNHMLAQYLSPAAVIKSVTVSTMTLDDVDVIDLNAYPRRERFQLPTRAESRIVVTWMSP